MRVFIIFIILCLNSLVQAQNYNNEIKIGLPIGGYFFDKTPLKFHSIADVPFPTYFSYCRKLNKHYFLTFNYKYFWLVYGDHGEMYYHGEVITRGFATYSLLLQKKLNIKLRVDHRIFIGGVFRSNGGELIFDKYIPQGTWSEIFLYYKGYNDFGISMGMQFALTVYKRFKIGMDLGYSRFFTKLSPNQFDSALSVGYNF